MKTLVLIDIQNDFVPGGSLPVPGGNQIVPVINKVLPHFDLVVATQDWHPKNHISFASNHSGKKPFETITVDGIAQTLWPDHCLQNSDGAEFLPDLETSRIEAIFRKGMDPQIDSYSGFYDNGYKRTTGLSGYLREKGVKELYFCGLAADVCVYFSVKDALTEGFSAVVIEDAVCALNQDEYQKQKSELLEMGATYMTSDKTEE